MNSLRITESARLFAGSTSPVTLRGGRSVAVRIASGADAGQLTAMHARCTPQTVHHRYHSTPRLTGRFLERLLDTDIALVAEAPNRSVVAIANLGRDTDGSGELAILVEDAWQGSGLGTHLLRHLVTMARLVGFAEVYAVCLADGGWAERAFARLGTPSVAHGSGQTWVRLTLGRSLTRLPDQLPAAVAATVTPAVNAA